MIKRLRLTFLGVSMALITLLLALILVLLCRFTWEDMRENTVSALQSAAQSFGHGERPGANQPMPQPASRPCFVLSVDPWGQLEASGSSYYDLSDLQMLQQILEAAQTSNASFGTLEAYSLAFYRADMGPAERYALTDISSEIATMRGLCISCIFIGIAAFVLFFVLMLGLSRWMVRPVEEAWLRQRQFVADASHELKTPLTVIMTNAELLQSPEYDADARRRFAGSIHTMSVQMRGLVEGLLDLARIDTQKTPRPHSPVDLSRLVEEAALPFEAVYFEAGRSLEITVEPDIRLTADGEQLRQVVEILLDNGCKYSREGTVVSLHLRRQTHSRAQLSVCSQGDSLTAQQCRDIFKRFYRVDQARKMNHSYGLGLSIAQAVVEAHKGKIWCESKDGKNIFYVNLPTQH